VSNWQSKRAKVAALERHHPTNTEAIAEARRDLRAERLADRIAQDVATWPPLTPEQRDRLAVLLRGGAA